MTTWGDSRKPGFYLAAQPLFRRGVLTYTPRTTGRAGDRMGTCLRGKVPRCLRRVGFLPPAEKAGAWPKTSRELGSSAEPAGQGGADGHGWAATLGSLQGRTLEATSQAGQCLSDTEGLADLGLGAQTPYVSPGHSLGGCLLSFQLRDTKSPVTCYVPGLRGCRYVLFTLHDTGFFFLINLARRSSTRISHVHTACLFGWTPLLILLKNPLLLFFSCHLLPFISVRFILLFFLGFQAVFSGR